MKTIVIPTYGNDVIHGLTFDEVLTYEEVSKLIDMDDAEDQIFTDLPGNSGLPDYRLDLLQFLSGNRTEEIAMRHCDTYLGQSGNWRVQVHINMRAYPDAVRLIEDKRKHKNYMAFLSGGDDIVLTMWIQHIDEKV